MKGITNVWGEDEESGQGVGGETDLLKRRAEENLEGVSSGKKKRK